MRSFARWSHRAAAIALWGLVIVLVATLVGHGETSGQELHHAGLVVDFGNGRIERRCVQFSEDEISGAELLRRSGLPVVFSGFGGLGSGVCRIDDTGCSDPGDCFCQCRGADCHYWTYWVLDNGAWRYQNVGASQRHVRNGDVDVWLWGPGASRPPGLSPTNDVCQIEQPTDAPLPTNAPPPTSAPRANTPAPGGGATPVISSRTPEGEAAGGVVTPQVRATETPRRTEQVRRPIATPADRSGDAARSGGGSGVPVGLIAFGALAGALVLGVGGLALRRRLRG